MTRVQSVSKVVVARATIDLPSTAVLPFGGEQRVVSGIYNAARLGRCIISRRADYFIILQSGLYSRERREGFAAEINGFVLTITADELEWN